MVFFQQIIYLKKIKDGTYVINLDEYADVGTHWIASFCSRNEIVYVDSFGVEHILEEIMLAGKKLTDYINLFSPHDLKKTDDIILSFFKNE